LLIHAHHRSGLAERKSQGGGSSILLCGGAGELNLLNVTCFWRELALGAFGNPAFAGESS